VRPGCPYPSAVTARTVPAPLAQLPNALTVARLAVIPAVAVLILESDGGHSVPAAILFGVAGITDQIDGYLARRWHVESAFGRIADPLADRILIDVTVLLLWNADRLPWIALVIPARDLALMIATPFAIGRGYRFEVNMLGKAATWILYASLTGVMVTAAGTDWPLVLFWIGVGLAFLALLSYARKARTELAP
jgi:CDP-diacylglycerol--glycerol-3-phosphate 3-phosphatidyltransferase